MIDFKLFAIADFFSSFLYCVRSKKWEMILRDYMLLAFLCEMKNGVNMTWQTVNRRSIKRNIERNERICIPIPTLIRNTFKEINLSIENIKRDNFWIDLIGRWLFYKSWNTLRWERTLATDTLDHSNIVIVKMYLWNNVKKLERHISFTCDYHFFENNIELVW